MLAQTKPHRDGIVADYRGDFNGTGTIMQLGWQNAELMNGIRKAFGVRDNERVVAMTFTREGVGVYLEIVESKTSGCNDCAESMFGQCDRHKRSAGLG